MANGLPVVASNVASIPEVVGDAGLLYDPNDVEGMIRGINLIMNDNNIKTEMIKKGIEQSSNFTWEKSVEKLVNVYNFVLSKE